MRDLPSLIELVHQYQAAASLAEREASAEQIVHRIEPDLRLFLWGRCDEQVVDDLLQEINLAFFKGIKAFEGDDDEQVWAWIYLIARRRAIDHGRSKKTDPLDQRADESFETILKDSFADLSEDPAKDVEMREALQRLRQIDPVCYEYLNERYIVGLSLVEMAKKRGIPPDTMRMRVNRCIKRSNDDSPHRR